MVLGVVHILLSYSIFSTAWHNWQRRKLRLKTCPRLYNTFWLPPEAWGLFSSLLILTEHITSVQFICFIKVFLNFLDCLTIPSWFFWSVCVSDQRIKMLILALLETSDLNSKTDEIANFKCCVFKAKNECLTWWLVLW